jgi:hypothetical protein
MFNQTYKTGLNMVLEKYQKMLNGEEKEMSLPGKKQEDDTLKRTILLEDSFRKWNESMNQIIILFVLSLFFSFIVFLIYLFFLPEMPVGIIIIVILSVGLIACGRQYYDSISRWKMDYDIYNIQPPELVPVDSSGNNIYSNAKGDLNTGFFNTSSTNSSYQYFCFDSSCCAEGTTWNPSTYKCNGPALSTTPPTGVK